MRVVIVGAGAVGTYLAERLSVDGQDVVVVEADRARAEEVQEQVDCLVIVGNGTDHETLSKAGVDRGTLFIAVSASDAVNILAAHAALRLGAERRIARVQDPHLGDEASALGVSLLIDPVDATAKELSRLVRQRGVTEMIPFAEGRLNLIGGVVTGDAPVAGSTLADLRRMVRGWTWIVVAVIRDGETLIARGSTQLFAGDHVLFMAESDSTDEAFHLLGINDSPSQKVGIFGATRLAALTAGYLGDDGVQTILVDEDGARVREIVEDNPRVVGIAGDPTDPRLLRSEGVDTCDMVLALTGWDDVNLLGCLVAKAIGVPWAVARFQRLDLVKLLAGVGIDAAISTRLLAASVILRFVRRGQIHSVTTFRDSDAEAIEVEVGPESRAVGKTLRHLHLPHEMIVGGVIRDTGTFVPRGETVIEPGDRLIVITLPEVVDEVERLSG